MAANLTTVDAILKEYYLGPLQKQLNNEVMCLELFQKMSVDWNGRQVIIPLHIARNTGVAYAGETDPLPVATNQGYEDLHIKAKFMYGKFQVTGPAMAAAKKGGKNSFIAALEGEMSGLKDDIRDRANRICFSGGKIKGYVNQRQAFANATTGAAGGHAAPNAGLNVLEYSGDFSPFASVVAATPATWVRVQAFNTLDFSEIVPAGANPGLFVADFDIANQTITIANVSSAGAGQAFSTAGVPQPQAIAIGLSSTAYTSGGALGTTVSFVNEPEGIYSNLSDPSWHSDIDRSSAANSILRCTNIHTVDKTTGVATAGNRVALDLASIQAVFDSVLLSSDKEPDCMIINPVARQRYISLLQGVINSEANTVTKGDGGFKSNQLSYGGVKFKVSRHCGRSMIVGLKLDGWKMLELQPGAFADLDGAVLSRDSNTDQWSGFYRWYYNQVCQRPNSNFVLVGFTV